MRNFRRLIKSANAIDCFPISEEDAKDVEELRKTFDNDSDLRAALEDYFHIYDDYAEMSEEEFDKGFKKFLGSSRRLMSAHEIDSSKFGEVKDDFCLGNITEKQALIELELAGKSEQEAARILDSWKENGIVKSSLDKAVNKVADYFGTVPNGNTVSCQDILTPLDEEKVKEIAAEEGVEVQIGQFSVRLYERPEPIQSSLIDKYIKKSGELVKETQGAEPNDEKAIRLSDSLDNLYYKLVDNKDPGIMYDNVEGEYTINGEDVKRYVINLLGEDYFDKNRLWDLLFDGILPNIRDFATTKEIAANYEIYQDLGRNRLKLVTNTMKKEEALTFKEHGFIVKCCKVIIDSGFTAGDEVVIEIERHGKWEIVAQSDDERGWTLSGDAGATIFDNREQARNSKLAQDLARAGYSPNMGNMRYTRYN